jgi:hypothetical protein
MSLAGNHPPSVTSVHQVGVSVRFGGVDHLTLGPFARHKACNAQLRSSSAWYFISDSNSREKHETHPPYNYIVGNGRWLCQR